MATPPTEARFDVLLLTRPRRRRMGSVALPELPRNVAIQRWSSLLPAPILTHLSWERATSMAERMTSAGMRVRITPAVIERWPERVAAMPLDHAPLLRLLGGETHPTATRRFLNAAHADSAPPIHVDSAGDLLGQLRGWLYTAHTATSWWPRHRAWGALCGALEIWRDPDAIEVAVDYTRAHLDELPAWLRTTSEIHRDPERRAAGATWPLIGALCSDDLRSAAPLPPNAQELDLTLCTSMHLHKPLIDHLRAGQLRRLGLGGTEIIVNELRAMVDAELLTRLTHLDLRGAAHAAAALPELLARPEAPRLTHLLLNGTSPRPATLRATLASPGAHTLTHFDLSHTSRGVSLLGALIEAPSPLHTLTLRDAELHGEALETLLGSQSRLTHLRCLDVSHNRIHEQPPALNIAAGLQALEHLGLADNGLSVDHVGRLVRPMRGALHSLDLRHNPLGDHSVGLLAESAIASQLTTLRLDDAQLGDVAAAVLAQAPALERLTTLTLSHNQLGPRAAALLAASPRLRALRSLDLSANPLGDQGVVALASAPWLAQLRHLSLWHVGLGPQGALALAEAPLEHLETLTLNANALGHQGLQALLGAPWMAHLRELHLRHIDLDEASIATLRDTPALARLDFCAL